MQNAIHTAYNWSADDLILAYRWHFRHTCRPAFRFGLHLIFALMLVAGCLSLLRGSESFSVTGGAFTIVGVYWFTLRPFERRWMIRRQFAKRPDHDALVEWTFSPELVLTSSPLGRAETQWKAFTKAVFTPDGILLYPNDQIFQFIPKRAFDCAETRAAFDSLVKSKVTHCHDVK